MDIYNVDVEDKHHLCCDRPRDFWLSREEEYQAYSLKKFPDQVWQEVQTNLCSNYWLVKKNKNREAEEEPEEDDNVELFLDV